MGPAELARTNAGLARNYIRNYEQMAGLVPYVIGRFTIMEARELGKNDIFGSGVIALTNAVDYGELLLEHVYPADAQAVPLMKQTLATGLEVKLDRGHDLSAVVHAERLADGRVLITAVPLLYGSYTVTQGRGTFSLEPPFVLNLAARLADHQGLDAAQGRNSLRHLSAGSGAADGGRRHSGFRSDASAHSLHQ